MSTINHQTKLPRILSWILVLVCVTAPVKGVGSRKLDENCTPCGGYTSPPPPSPADPPPSPPPPIVYPSPPPPLIYLSPPPPSPKKPSSQYCPPPPSSYTYITGPPGNLYPVVESFNGASHNRYRSFTAFLPLLVGLLTLLT